MFLLFILSLFPMTIYIYIYIYILTNLLSTSIHSDKEKEKGKKNARIQRYQYLGSVPGEKRNRLSREKKRKDQLRHTSWKKKQAICNQFIKSTKTHHKMLQCYNY